MVLYPNAKNRLLKFDYLFVSRIPYLEIVNVIIVLEIIFNKSTC